MTIVENINNVELVSSFRNQSDAYRQQWANWLGLGSAGGILAILSFAANLPDPDYALRNLAPGLAAFTFGTITAAPSLLFRAFEASAASEHFASSANRDSLRNAIDKLPIIIASPQSIADNLNMERNNLISMHDQENKIAKIRWRTKMRWRWAKYITTGFSAIGFLIGATFPLSLVFFDTKIVPIVAQKKIC